VITVPHYTDEEKERAISLYFSSGLTSQKVVDELRYPSRQNLELWLKKDTRYGDGNFRHGFYPIALKREAVRLRLEEGRALKDIASRLHVKNKVTVQKWVAKFEEEGDMGLVPKKKSASQPEPDVPDMPDDIDGLKKRCEELELENAVMKEMLDVLKVDPCASTADLSSTERTLIADSLKKHFGLSVLLKRLGLKRSTYYHAKARLDRPDRHAGLRRLIVEIYEHNQGRYGYRRIWMVLRNEHGVVVSEKIVRRLMAQEGLVAKCVRKRYRYNSYKGEISDAPPNLINRDFSADKPNEKWLTDITEMKAADGKLYLSPVVDCFDGMVVAWRMSRNPNAIRANSMLEDAIATLPKGAHPLIHSDRGVHYRWDGWIDLMRHHGLVRSMSRKGCSPDNSAAEGMFGRLKVEMYYGGGWEKRTVAELEQTVDVYLHWYNEERIKMSLDGLSPMQYRRQLGLAA
jgi:transposase InsO family protein/transposase-like protein